MQTTTPQFDPVKYKNTTRDQWQTAAESWFRWSPTLNQWLGEATETMLEMAGVSAGHRVLYVAAGAGEQSVTIAKKVGATSTNIMNVHAGRKRNLFDTIFISYFLNLSFR